MQKAIFAAGCFWGVESAFRDVSGVRDAICGYTGGRTRDPTYESICKGDTGHAEAVEVIFDDVVVSYETLVEAFFKLHDPTQRNRQGPDVGSQYRSGIFPVDAAQRATAERVRARLEERRVHGKPITTEITDATTFYRAEDYHQRYFEKKRGLFSFGLA